MDLTLTFEEKELVLEILVQRQRALQREISHTDHHEFKRTLRMREKVLESIVSRLSTMQPMLEPMPELHC